MCIRDSSIIIFQGEKGLPGSNGGPGPNGPIGDPGRTGKSGKRGPSGGMVKYDFSLFIIISFFLQKYWKGCQILHQIRVVYKYIIFCRN